MTHSVLSIKRLFEFESKNFLRAFQNKKLEVALSEKTSELSTLTVVFKQSENIQEQTIKELEEERQKVLKKFPIPLI